MAKNGGIINLLLAITCILSCVKPIASREDNYTLLWADEFNEDTINQAYWSKMQRVKNVRSFCHLTDDVRMFEKKKGFLRLWARYNDGYAPADTAHFLTAGITSAGKKTFQFGKIMIRARMHGAIGTWPAIWVMPEDKKRWGVDHKQYAEIDICEYVDRNDFVYQTAHNHYTLQDKAHWSKPPHQSLPKIKTGKFNIYCVEILPDELIFSVNGKETLHYPRIDNIEYQYPYGIESQIRIHEQVNPPKWWSPQGIDVNSFPGYMDIDWVRVYSLKDNK